MRRDCREILLNWVIDISDTSGCDASDPERWPPAADRGSAARFLTRVVEGHAFLGAKVIANGYGPTLLRSIIPPN